ncbi:MAG: putative phasyl DNA replicon protein arp [Circular genetic element sp.]|nr:MAG: putative phasyl DNA replicon protein arp [Circular genetic element sp.]
MNIIDSVTRNSSDASRVSNPLNSYGLSAFGSAPEGGSSFPCLNSHISIENVADWSKSALPVLSTNHRKSAFILSESVRQVAGKFGLSQLGFLTLTFADHVLCPKEAQRRLNSLISNVINDRYLTYLGCFERQKSGRIHYHLLVVLPVDIRTGFDFQAAADRDYRTANKALRAEWAFWRATARRYGFGRTELLPVRTNTAAIAKYVGKYISKHCAVRGDSDKGVRLVRYGRGARAGTCHFQFLSSGSFEWRRKVATFAGVVQAKHPETLVCSMRDLTRVLGPRWAYRNRDYILSL